MFHLGQYVDVKGFGRAMIVGKTVEPTPKYDVRRVKDGVLKLYADKKYISKVA